MPAEFILDPREGSFKDWSDRIKAEAEYIKALGTYKMADAQAQLAAAEAASEEQRAREWQFLINRMQRDMQHADIERSHVEAEMDHMRHRSVNATMLLKGRWFDANALENAWMSFNNFKVEIMASGSMALSTVTVPTDAHEKSNFINNQTRGAGTNDLPTTAANAMQMLAWMKQQHYVAADGSPAQNVIIVLFKTINDFAKEALEEMNARRDAIQAKNFDVWNPGVLLATLTAGKAIEAAKPPAS